MVIVPFSAVRAIITFFQQFNTTRNRNKHRQLHTRLIETIPEVFTDPCTARSWPYQTLPSDQRLPSIPTLERMYPLMEMVSTSPVATPVLGSKRATLIYTITRRAKNEP